MEIVVTRIRGWGHRRGNKKLTDVTLLHSRCHRELDDSRYPGEDAHAHGDDGANLLLPLHVERPDELPREERKDKVHRGRVALTPNVSNKHYISRYRGKIIPVETMR